MLPVRFTVGANNMPLAKTADTLSVQVTPSVNPPDNMSRLDIGGVPVSVYEFFDAPLTIPEKEVGKLKVIVDWAKSEVKDGTEGDLLLKIRDLRNHLGSPDGFQKQYDKLYNYCKMTMQMREIEKKRDALSRRY